MIYDCLYWYFTSAISKKDCQKIIKAGFSKTIKKGTIMTMNPKKLSKNDISILKKIRKSTCSFLYEKWIYDLLHKYVSIANRDAGWNYTLTHSEGTQFTIYNKKVILLLCQIFIASGSGIFKKRNKMQKFCET